MTETPEHLLKRSRERRAATGSDGASTDAAGGGKAAAPAAQTSAAPAKASPMPAHPTPDRAPAGPAPSPMVAVYRRRRKIPFWAMPVLAALPLWAYIYQGTLSPPPAGEGPETRGAELFSEVGCSGCHGAGGGGSGSFPGFTDGRIFETFPAWPTHFEWVRLGSAGWLDERGPTYGATDKPVQGGMPAFTEEQLSDAELVYIVLHERLLGGANPDEKDLAQLEQLALYMSEHETLTLEEAVAELELDLSFETRDPEADPGHADPPPARAPERDDTPGSEGNEQASDGGGDQTGNARGVAQSGDHASNSGQAGASDEPTPQAAEDESNMP